VLIEVLRTAAADAPDRPFLVSARRTVTYAEALAAAETCAGGLRSRGLTRFGVVVADPVELVLLLCAASAVGAEPCSYPRDADAATIADNAASFEHAAVVTDRELVLDAVRVVALAGLAAGGGAAGPAAAGAPVPPDVGEATVLILTTGTTGRPKGARHVWARLLPRPDRTGPPDARWLLAYNLNQFAGVQVFLQVLASHATLVVPESNQPRAAAAAMKEFGVTHASGTPTFWRFVSSLLDRPGDLALQQITLGGEAVPAALLDTLYENFPGVRLSQVYASTELGSTVSVRDGKHGLPLSVLDRGDEADVQFRIVDGELQGRSRVGMVGYHGQEAESGGWRPTGDLVEVQGDRIVFVGRTSEVINVGGVKVHPLPVEEAVSAVDGVELAHVYGRANPVAGQIVVADVVARAGVDHEALEDAIRSACAGLPRAAQPRRIRFVDDLAVRENKIVRRAEPVQP
jgi:acyl-CoA synthetase (AMP-forming)/AMP-acid ligase II